MKKKLCVLLSLVMVLSMAACSGNAESGNSSGISSESEQSKAKDLGYTYGEHFWSDEPMTFTMFWSDHEAYPITDSWEIFDKIKEMTNVTLDISGYIVARADYNSKTSLMINAGEAPYIIPKIYDESAFVDGGAVAAVSDWTEYMPNYTRFVEDYDMQSDLDSITKSNGKYYRLPGLKEVALQTATLVARNDIFEAAGYDLRELEKNWTWDDLYEVLVGVKAYMVEQGMCSASDYIWSERWPGDDGSGGFLPKIVGASYNVPSGWALSGASGMAYDYGTESFYFAETSEDYKQYVSALNKFVDARILDPESFTQTDEQAVQKFYRGETVIIGGSEGAHADYIANLNSTLGEDSYELYMLVYPEGLNDYRAENSRLESGVMISRKALDELGEDDFIKMMRFIDWLFYSDEASGLVKWGIEGTDYTQGETYEIVTDEETGLEIKQLLSHWYCGGLGIGQTSDDQEDMRIKFGYAGGVFMYGGTAAQQSDAFPAVVQDYIARSVEYRSNKPLEPTIKPAEDENEQINLWKTPLLDNVNSWTLQFITGKKSVETDWDTYVESCKNLKSVELTALYNEIHNRDK